jgi:multiple antibiotic resistance protein
MFEAVISFLVLLNPVAMFIFLQPVIRKISPRELMVILAKASVVAFAIFVLFAIGGDIFFQKILQIQFDSFRIFGGLVITYLSFVMIVRDKKSFITYNKDHSIISGEIVMPLMVGAGTISLSVLMGKSFGKVETVAALAVVMAITYLLIVMLTLLRHRIVSQFEKAFDKNMDMVLRLIAFFAGAIGLNMVVVGVQNIWG